MHKVAVITRTKNRSLFLARTLESLINQSFKDFVWVIVNDGGSSSEVDRIKERALQSRINTLGINKDRSEGMEAASNSGILASESDYIVILDDDDTWHPDFLAKTLGFLESVEGAVYMGVVTQTMRIFERITEGFIQETNSYCYNGLLKAAYFSEMLKGNFFTNNSFVYRRIAHDSIGYFDASLPVRGDWEFNIRFMAKFDIGVIPEPLANWHIRTTDISQSEWNNTVVAQKDRHKEFDALIRNRYLRKDLEEHRFGIGVFLNLQSNKTVLTIPSERGRIFSFFSRIARFLRIS